MGEEKRKERDGGQEHNRVGAGKEERKKKGGLVPIYHSDSWPCGWPWDLTASSSSLIFPLLPCCPYFSTPLISLLLSLIYHSPSVISLLTFCLLLFFLSFSLILCYTALTFYSHLLLLCLPYFLFLLPSFLPFYHTNKDTWIIHKLHRLMCCLDHQESRNYTTVHFPKCGLCA